MRRIIFAALLLFPSTLFAKTIVSQIHNAPGWLPDHTYGLTSDPAYHAGHTRVNSGPGWNPAITSWDPDEPLAAYQLASSGTCVSGTKELSGTGASIKDGTCTWRYLSRTDYISITGWTFDNRKWAKGTHYSYHEIVTSGSPLRAYILTSPGGCMSTTAPTGAASTAVSAGDSCTWQYLASILYSSGKSYIPTQTYTKATSAWTVNLRASYEAEIWNDREYIAGRNGENSPISIVNHDQYYGEGQTLRYPYGKYRVLLTAAPGESFMNHLTPNDPLTGFNPNDGVAIYDTNTYRWPTQPDGLMVENQVTLFGLQIRSLHGSAVGSLSTSYDNDVTIKNCILDGGNPANKWTDPEAVSVDTGSAVLNSLVITHSPLGVRFKYPGYAVHDTIIGAVPSSNSVGITTWHNWIFPGQVVSNTAIFGFAHAAASAAKMPNDGSHWVWTGTSWLGGNNATDAPIGDSGRGSDAAGTVVTLPRTAYGVSAAAAFVNPGRDWRVKKGGPLYDTGTALGLFNPTCQKGKICARTEGADTPDLIGTPRLQNGYDIGAWQTPGETGKAAAGEHKSAK